MVFIIVKIIDNIEKVKCLIESQCNLSETFRVVTWCIKCSEMIIIVYSFTWQDG